MKLYPFQQEGVKYALTHRYTINACEMGLGKTVQALSAFKDYKKAGCLSLLIICPAYLKRTWELEWKKIDPEGEFDFPEILSYEAFTRNYKKTYAEFVIFDEAHYLKNMGSKRTKAAHTFIKETTPHYLMLLTGTPIKNRVTEFYSLLKLCSYCPTSSNGLRLTKSFHHFANKLTYVREYDLPNGVRVRKYEGLKNKPLLLKYLEGKYFRKKASEVLDLPAVIEKEVYISDDVGNELQRELKEQFENRGSSHISTAKAFHAKLKANFCASYTKELIDQDLRPILVFTDHVAAAHEIQKRLKDAKVNAAVVTGQTGIEVRNKCVDLFQAGKLEVLVATIGSMSTGFTLTATNRIIFNDLSWVPGDNLQAVARIRRIGQERTCFVTYICSEGIDTMIAKTLREKMQTLEAFHEK